MTATSEGGSRAFISDNLSRREFVAGASAGMLTLGLLRGTAAQTPVAEVFAPFTDRINELMALVPGQAGEESDDMLALTFADLERQLASVGMPVPEGEELPEGFGDVTQSLPLSDGFRFALLPEWWETFGFEPLKVGRTLEVGEPGNSITIYAGGIDPERVREALLAAGYREVEAEAGGPYLTFGEDFSPSTVVGRLGVGSMNQAVVRDDAVVFSHREAMIQQVVQVIAGNAPSMLEQGGWAKMATEFSPDVVAVMGAYPAILADLGDVSTIRRLAFGVREGADNRGLDSDPVDLPATAVADLPETRARVQLRIKYVDAETAEREAEAIPERWSSMASPLTNQPFGELMLVEDGYVSDRDPTVAAIDFRTQGPAATWNRLLLHRDLTPLVPASQ